MGIWFLDDLGQLPLADFLGPVRILLFGLLFCFLGRLLFSFSGCRRFFFCPTFFFSGTQLIRFILD
ncbi:hypothetical protein D3791_15405 [Glutamicibacter mishrai]|uniref:Uncharacterized protein n=1 Tax=Glutamicibacter mishrai TaxID=1775880 RepID=A0A6H0SMH9_9MICC|nr:hypothetical protein D3791_15405 [Glutamicibacter mishrai]